MLCGSQYYGTVQCLESRKLDLIINWLWTRCAWRMRSCRVVWLLCLSGLLAVAVRGSGLSTGAVAAGGEAPVGRWLNTPPKASAEALGGGPGFDAGRSRHYRTCAVNCAQNWYLSTCKPNWAIPWLSNLTETLPVRTLSYGNPGPLALPLTVCSRETTSVTVH